MMYHLRFKQLNKSSVYKVDPAGVLTLVAGYNARDQLVSYLFGLGDGGPATEARLKSPEGVALDAAGNLFLADTQNHRIRRVEPNRYTSRNSTMMNPKAAASPRRRPTVPTQNRNWGSASSPHA